MSSVSYRVALVSMTGASAGRTEYDQESPLGTVADKCGCGAGIHQATRRDGAQSLVSMRGDFSNERAIPGRWATIKTPLLVGQAAGCARNVDETRACIGVWWTAFREGM